MLKMTPPAAVLLLLLLHITQPSCRLRAEPDPAAAADPAPIIHPSTHRPSDLLTPPAPPFYQRIARWFGFAGGVPDDSATATSFEHSQQLQRRAGYTSSEKSAAQRKPQSQCNPCNKIPWTPIVQSRQRQFPSAAAAASHNQAVSLGLPIYPLYSSYRSLPQTAPAASTLELQPNGPPHAVYGPPQPQQQPHPQPQSPPQQPPAQQPPPLPPIKLIDTSSAAAQPPINYGLPARQQSQPFNSYGPPPSGNVKEDLTGRPYAAAVQRPLALFPQAQQLPFSYQLHHQQYHNVRPYNVATGAAVQIQAQPLMHIALPTYAAPAAASALGRPLDYYQQQQNQQLVHRQRMVPIPIPNLSHQPLPPLFNAKPFLAQIYGYPSPVRSTLSPTVADQKPQQSNIAATTAGPYPTSVAAAGQQHNPADDVEIVRSVPLAEFTSSVEYPIEVHRSPVLEINVKAQHTVAGSDVEHSANRPAEISRRPYSQPEVIVAEEDPYDYSRPRGSASDNRPEASNRTEVGQHFDRDGSIQSIQTQLVSGYGAAPITVHPDLLQTEWSPVKLASSTEHYDRASYSTFSTYSTYSPATPSALTVTTRGPQSVVGLPSKDRGTPKALLDSPIYYLNKSTLPTRSPEHLKVTRSEALDRTPWLTSVASEPTTPKAIRSEAKTPRQIIIPYTVQQHPSPFQQQQQQQQQQHVRQTDVLNAASALYQNFDSSAGWSVQSHHSDPHDSQESKVVTATAEPHKDAKPFTSSSTARTTTTTSTTPTPATTSTTTPAPTTTTSRPPSTSKYLTKIRASNLRELLRQEKSHPSNSLDFDRLQKNIDVWTEQEFGELGSAKASTISGRTQSKIIPSEYLTTTMTTPVGLNVRSAKGATSTEAIQHTTFDPDVLADEAYHSDDEKLDSLSQNSIAEADLWQSLKLAISPVTREKVYVVTPQPWHDVEEETENASGMFDLTGEASISNSVVKSLNDSRPNVVFALSEGRPFKSPRFLVRPTPGPRSTSSAAAMADLLRGVSLPERVNKLQSSESHDNSLEFRASTPLEPHPNAKDASSKVFEMVTPPSSFHKYLPVVDTDAKN